MNRENKNTPTYQPPKLEVLEIMIEQSVLQASWLSGSAPDSDDSEFDLYDSRGLNW